MQVKIKVTQSDQSCSDISSGTDSFTTKASVIKSVTNSCAFIFTADNTGTNVFASSNVIAISSFESAL